MSNRKTPQQIVSDGLWHNNAGLVQLLGLCPLLAISTTLINALALALATLVVLMFSNVIVSLFRRALVRRVRLMFYVVVIAGGVSVVDQWMAAWRYELYQNLGIFVPLIATNCAIVARAELCASHQPPGHALLDALATGAGFGVLLIVVGGLREAIGRGALLTDAHTLFGPAAASWTVQFADGFLLAVLPPGAFFVLAALVATHRALSPRPIEVNTG
ncbi:MAG: electron transport complex subunit RsxE [Gammaproteobacteria bacterium]